MTFYLFLKSCAFLHNSTHFPFPNDKKTLVMAELILAGGWRSGSAGALQASGRGFKSLTAHHLNAQWLLV